MSFKLSSGKTIYPNNDIVGINPQMHVFEGYDAEMYEEDYTLQEKIEIAEHAISLWMKYLRHLTGKE